MHLPYKDEYRTTSSTAYSSSIFRLYYRSGSTLAAWDKTVDFNEGWRDLLTGQVGRVTSSDATWGDNFRCTFLVPIQPNQKLQITIGDISRAGTSTLGRTLLSSVNQVIARLV